MYYKQLLLAVAAVFIVIIFFNIEVYDNWYNERISEFSARIADEVDNTDYEWRRQYKWGGAYELANFCKTKMKADTDQLLILPPQEYVKQINSQLLVPEPITLYYWTGIRAVYPTHKDAVKGKYALYIENGNVMLVKIPNAEVFEMLKKKYNL